jgi:SAM-dependent methyltransferase
VTAAPYRQPSFARRLREHAHEEGAARVAARMGRWALGAAIPRGGSFTFADERYELLRRVYGLTWMTERAVEVPVARRVVERHREERILEVGNVLSHYMPAEHEVVDKYERAAGVRNVDVLELAPEPGYDLVVSVSTLEHVGRDEQPREPERAAAALEHLRRLLRPGGKLFATVPAGYNPALDDAVARGEHEVRAMRRDPWREVEPAEALSCPYDFLVYRAEAVLFVTADALRSA